MAARRDSFAAEKALIAELRTRPVAFGIKTPAGWVHRFTQQCGGMVQVAVHPTLRGAMPLEAKHFTSYAAAQAFINKYADAGYGLQKATAEILEVVGRKGDR